MSTLLTPQERPATDRSATEKRYQEWGSSTEYRAEIEASEEIARLLQRNAGRKHTVAPPPTESIADIH